MLIDDEISGDRNVTMQEAENFKVSRPYSRNSAHVECESESEIGINRGDWNYFKITQTILEQHNKRARN